MLKRVLFMIPAVLTAYAIASFVGPLAVDAQQAQPTPLAGQHDHDQPSQANTPDMMKMHQQMTAEMKAADAKLDQLLSRMNAAMGDAKTSALAEVVTELVRQQKAMHARMGLMHDQMMMGGRGMMMKKP